jgi:hypothetical protein
MRKIREVLRLRFGHGLSQRAVARSLQLSAGAVNGYLSRARRAGIAWPMPDDLDDEQLERRLFPLPPDVPVDLRRCRVTALWCLRSVYVNGGMPAPSVIDNEHQSSCVTTGCPIAWSTTPTL